MRKTKISVYSRDVLKELAVQYPDKWNKVQSKNKEKWLMGTDFPTYKQLVDISKAFKIPFGYLFLDSLPKIDLPVIHFRTLRPQDKNEPSEQLKEAILLIKKYQEWTKDFLIEWGSEPLPFAGKYTTTTPIEEVVQKMREILGVRTTWAALQISWQKAFNYLVSTFEKAGIYVSVSTLAEDNTHSQLTAPEVRGFVLYDEYAPFVFVNNNDFLSAKIFTLMHELAHILVGQSASFDLAYLQTHENEVEKFCNQCAAEFLVPTAEIEPIQDINEETYQILAKRFKVSPLLIARRLLDLKRITQTEYKKFFQIYQETTPKKRSNTSKANFYKMAVLRYGKKFLQTLKYAYQAEHLSERDLCHLLNLNLSTVHKLFEKV
ncbi:MAG: ImmA/IrrE family metallo-endopeptidase [Bacteroidia bacterium]|nr:ImmA/IrrE family metallo-endopeptidase [Bacteroidia bacterium]MDW8302223.1 ImmA/IrrE family metallo-endopeptidase [Bacteroidia bacterium]